MKNDIIPPSATEQALAKIEFTDVKAFEAIVAAISGLADKYRGLKITDTKSYKACTQGIAEMRNLRISVEARRKEKKADILAAGRQIDSGAKQITKLLLPIETELKTTKQAEDTRKDAIKAEKEQAEKERIKSIQAKIVAFPPDMSRLPQLLKMTAPGIQEMQDALTALEIDIEDYQEFTPDAIKAKGEKKKLLQEYYIARITADAKIAKQKAEAKHQEQTRLIEEAALKKQEQEQKVKQEIEDMRLAKIRGEQEAEAQKLHISQVKIETQKQALKKEYDRLEDEKIERERIEQERLAKIEADRVAKIEAEKQEKARIEQEVKEETKRKKAEAEEKARQEALRPDRENLLIYLDTLKKQYFYYVPPAIKTSEGNIVLSFIQTGIEKVFVDTLEKLKEM